MKKFELPSQTLAIAVSGGVDSMSLALLLNNWAKNNNHKIHALIVDHGLRGNSADEACEVRKSLEGKGVPAIVLAWEGAKPESNIQAIARAKRYELLLNWCKENDAQALFTAHHQDDLIETFLQRVVRGSGLKGLAGIREEGVRDGIKIIRPLLEIPKDRLAATLSAKGIKWFEDETNATDKYQRNRIRKAAEIIKEEGASATRITATMKALAGAEEALHYYANKAFEKHVVIYPEMYGEIDSKIFNEPHETVIRVVRRALLVIGDGEEVRQEKLGSLIEWMVNGKGQRTIAGTIITLTKKGYLLTREIGRVKEASLDEYNVFDGRFTVTSKHKNLTVRYLAEEGWQGVSASFRSKIKVRPKLIVFALPAFFKNGRVIAVPYINYYAKGYAAGDFVIKAKNTENFA